MLQRPLALPLTFTLALAMACTGAVNGPDPGTSDVDEPDQTGSKPPKKPGDTTPPPPPVASRFTCDPSKMVLPGPRVWRLTATQLNNTVKDLIGDASGPARGEFFQGAGQEGFLNNAFDLRVRDTEAVQLRLLAKTMAAGTVADEKRLALVFDSTGCTAAKLADATCSRQFVSEFGKRAFRRPLETAEVDDYLALYKLGQAKGDKLGVQVVVEAMLQSPKFLYRSELGTGTGRVRLSPHELATALSYHLTGTMPDAELMRAADRNELAMPAQLEAHARRLIAKDQAKGALFEFYRQFLEYAELDTRDKDPMLFPEYEGTRKDMLEELRRFVDDVAFGTAGGGTWKTMLTANYTFANAGVAKLYGQTVSGTGWQRITTKTEERAGIVTMPGLMSHLAVLERTSPVNRGRFVQERLFCTHIPDPPGDADTAVPELSPGLTRRQQLEAKTGSGTCGACHGLINGIGFGLENLDAIGRFRTHENDLAIDPKGEIKGTQDSNGVFTGPRGLAEKLAASAQVGECVARQSFRYAAGRAETDGDACSLKTIHDRFVASGGKLQELAVAFVLSEAFAYRQR